MNDIKAISFDLDDTLWAIGPVIERAEAALGQWLSEHVPDVARRYPPDAVAALRREVMRDHADMLHDLTFIRKQVLARMGRSSGVGDAFVEEAFAAFDAARNRVELFPEVGEVLEDLAKRFTLIAVTNGNARLELIGIDRWFTDCVAARQVGAAKPHRSVFDAAVRAARTTSEAMLHVGDHPEHDVHGAKSAGLRAIWVNRHGVPYPAELQPPDATVADLRQLYGLLERP